MQIISLWDILSITTKIKQHLFLYKLMMELGLTLKDHTYKCQENKRKQDNKSLKDYVSKCGLMEN